MGLLQIDIETPQQKKNYYLIYYPRNYIIELVQLKKKTSYIWQRRSLYLCLVSSYASQKLIADIHFKILKLIKCSK